MDSTNDLLMRAIYENDPNAVQYCLRRGVTLFNRCFLFAKLSNVILAGVNLNKICQNGMTHLGAAAQTGNLFILQMMLEQQLNSLSNLDIENDNSTNSGMLHLDVALGKRQNMGYFVVCKDMDENDLGDGPTPDGMEALEWDVEITDENVKEEESICPEVKLYKWYAKILNQTSVILKSPDNDIARLDGHGQNILHYSIRSGNKDMVEYLVNNYSELSVNQSDSNWYSPLHISVMTANIQITKFLLSKNANINSVNRDRQTPLHLAAQYGLCELIVLLLENGANINSFDIDERSPLTLAVAHSKEDAARILIKRGIRLNHEESNGYTVLYRAVWNDLTNTVKFLIENGAKIIHSHFLLHVATKNGNLEIVKILVKAGAIVNIRDEQGMTPLIIACSIQNLHIAKYLLKNGASANTANHITGLTPLHICVQDITDPRQLQQFIDLLVSHNADINANSYQGTVLFYSIILGNFPAACLLVKHGADVNLREERAYIDNLSLAKKHGNLELVKMIVYAGFSFENILFDIKSLRNKSGEDEAHDFLMSVWSSPLNLRELCRVTIRKALGKHLLSKFSYLPLPRMMQQYLALEIL